jgi:putative transposase
MIDENQAIVVETLKVKNVLKNRKLSKHTADTKNSKYASVEYQALAAPNPVKSNIF